MPLHRPDGSEVVGPLDAGVAQVGERDAAGVADRGVAAGEVDRREVGDAFVPVGVGEQYLAAPDGAVVAEARAVEREPDDPLVRVALVLGHHRRDVGVVMLDLDDPIGVVGARPPGGCVAGVGIDGDDVGRDRVDPLELGDESLERFERLEVLHVAEVLAHEGALGRRQAERVLEFSTDGQHRAAAAPDRHGQRCEAAGAADREQDVAGDTDDRVVARHVDLAVVHEETVAETGQPRDRFDVDVRDRLAGEVAARHHERGSAEAEQQVLQRGRREHDPEHRVAGSDECRDACVGPGAEQHDRPGRCEQLGGLGVTHLGEAAGGVEVRDHDGERLVGTMLALPQALHCGVVGRVAGEVIATEALDGDRSTGSGSLPAPP